MDDVAYARTEIREERRTVLPSPTGDVLLDGPTSAAHRDFLLTISKEERVLRDMEAKGVKVSSLRESIGRDVEKLLSTNHARSAPPVKPEIANTVEYYIRWEHEAEKAMTVDLCIIGASVLCAWCAVWMWFRLQKPEHPTG